MEVENKMKKWKIVFAVSGATLALSAICGVAHLRESSHRGGISPQLAKASLVGQGETQRNVSIAGTIHDYHASGIVDRNTNPQVDKAAFAQKTQKLQMPFIANEGQTDAKVAFYANTFGGTVFVTKEGDIVYSLPSGRDVPGGASQEAGRGGREGVGGELHLPDHAPCRDTEPRVPMSPLQYLASLTHSPKGDVLCRVLEKRESRIMDYVSWFEGCAPDGREMGLHVSNSPRGWDTASRVPTTAARRDTASRVPGVALKEEFVGARVSGIKGEGESVTKVSYFKGNDPSKWKTNVSTYDFVNLGEIYKGIELRLKAYGDNVEKLFCVKPGADPEQIKISLSGLQPLETPMIEEKQPPESPFIKGEDRRPGGDVSTKSPLSNGWDFADIPLNKGGEGVVFPGNEKGARGLSVNEHGELEVETALGTVKFTKPVAYQEIDGKRVEVAVEYKVESLQLKDENTKCETRNTKLKTLNAKLASTKPNPQSEIANSNRKSKIVNRKFEYGFAVASYDRTKPLIIDPLLASTFLGGSYDEVGNSLTLDTSGNVYVTGATMSTDFPTTSGAYDTSFNGFNDIFVSKLNSGLTSLLASTFLGGAVYDWGSSLTLDTSGNVYVTGETTSTDFPTTSGAYDTSFNGYYDDVFVSKLNGGLTSLLASTFLGGSGDDYGDSLALDTSGNVYVTGATDWTDFPTTPGAYDTSYNGGNWNGNDVFVSKLSGDLTSLLASTYLGGTAGESGRSIATDTRGNVYVTGYTYSSNFPTTIEAYDTSYNGGPYTDAFISKLNSGLTSLLASTFLGGSNGGDGESLTLDTSGNVYVTGYTESTDFPTTSGAYDTSFNGGYWGDVFVSKLNSGLTSLLASTFLGGFGIDSSKSLTLDTSGNVYGTGSTASSDFPTTSGAYDTSFNGGYWGDVFVSKLN